MESLVTANIRSRPTRTFISILAVAIGVILILIIGGITSGTLNDYLDRNMAVGADFILQPTHRFAHSLGYMRRLAAVHGFAIESVESRAIRKNADTDVPGYLVVMRRD